MLCSRVFVLEPPAEMSASASYLISAAGDPAPGDPAADNPAADRLSVAASALEKTICSGSGVAGPCALRRRVQVF
jgi:hypothetical protein